MEQNLILTQFVLVPCLVSAQICDCSINNICIKNIQVGTSVKLISTSRERRDEFKNAQVLAQSQFNDGCS